jgi:hypothetical protein
MPTISQPHNTANILWLIVNRWEPSADKKGIKYYFGVKQELVELGVFDQGEFFLVLS